MKILITGAYGQLGNELARCLTTGRSELGPIPAEYDGAEVDYVDYDQLDIADADAVDAWFQEHGPMTSCSTVRPSLTWTAASPTRRALLR